MADGSNANTVSKAMLDSQIVTGTLNAVNKAGQRNAHTGLITSKADLNNRIITGTLDAINKEPGYAGTKSGVTSKADMSASYDFNRSVLSAVYEGKGTIVDGHN